MSFAQVPVPPFWARQKFALFPVGFSPMHAKWSCPVKRAVGPVQSGQNTTGCTVLGMHWTGT